MGPASYFVFDGQVDLFDGPQSLLWDLVWRRLPGQLLDVGYQGVENMGREELALVFLVTDHKFHF